MVDYCESQVSCSPKHSIDIHTEHVVHPSVQTLPVQVCCPLFASTFLKGQEWISEVSHQAGQHGRFTAEFSVESPRVSTCFNISFPGSRRVAFLFDGTNSPSMSTHDAYALMIQAGPACTLKVCSRVLRCLWQHETSTDHSPFIWHKASISCEI